VAESDERTLRTLTLLVAVCEQAALELQRIGWSAPLLHRLEETHDLAVDAIRSRLGTEIAPTPDQPAA
jgi:hypothetical protein